jgi:hypothetical protein
MKKIILCLVLVILAGSFYKAEAKTKKITRVDLYVESFSCSEYHQVCSLGVVVKQWPNADDYGFRWRTNLDNGGMTKWISGDDIFNVEVPINAYGEHKVKVQFKTNPKGYFGSETFTFVVPQQ